MSENKPSAPPAPEGEASNTEAKVITRDERDLVVSFIQYLRQKVSANDCNNDQIEGIESAVQCLEGVFGLTDKNYTFQTSKPLLAIFKDAKSLTATEDEFPEPTQAEIDEANKLNEEGNELVKASKFQEAILKHNEAIKRNRDPTYFCNRAAAYCRLEQHDLAIQDCRTALALDPNYAKAYGRMGVALSCQNRYDQAVEAYKQAIELDPSNESYKQNLSIAEEKLAEAQNAAFAGMPGLGGLGGLGGMGAMLNNPQMAEVAAQMMSNPNVQNKMGEMMNAFSGQGAGFENLLQFSRECGKVEALVHSNRKEGATALHLLNRKIFRQLFADLGVMIVDDQTIEPLACVAICEATPEDVITPFTDVFLSIEECGDDFDTVYYTQEDVLRFVSALAEFLPCLAKLEKSKFLCQIANHVSGKRRIKCLNEVCFQILEEKENSNEGSFWVLAKSDPMYSL